MTDIKKLLNKKKLTGKEIAIIEITNKAVRYKQVLKGETPKSIIEDDKLMKKMEETLTNLQQIDAYRECISIYGWLLVKYNIAQTQEEQAKSQILELYKYITDAILAEDVYEYIEKLPVVMTQKQYDDAKEAYFKDQENENKADQNIFDLIKKFIDFHLEQLEKYPNNPNPLKDIKDKYMNQRVTSEIILNRYNELTYNGYFTKNGKKFDQISEEKLREVAYAYLKRRMNRIQLILNGATKAESYIKEEKKFFEENGMKWHPYNENPTDLSKWHIIEEGILLNFYPASDSKFYPYPTNLKQDLAEIYKPKIEKYKDILKITGGILELYEAKFNEYETMILDLLKEETSTSIYDVRNLHVFLMDLCVFMKQLKQECPELFDETYDRLLDKSKHILKKFEAILLGKSKYEKHFYVSSNFYDCLNDFKQEFPELLELILSDIDKNYFKAEKIKLSELSLEELANFHISLRNLYEWNFYGIKDEIDFQIQPRANNRKSNKGVAIFHSVRENQSNIDENGYYIEPSINNNIKQHSLEIFFKESESYTDKVTNVKKLRKTLLDSYYFLMCYNYAIDRIISIHDLAELDVFKRNIDLLSEKIETIHTLITTLYIKIEDINYNEKEKQKKKLQVLVDLFYPIEYKSLVIPEKHKEIAEELISNCKAFSDSEKESYFYELFFIRK